MPKSTKQSKRNSSVLALIGIGAAILVTIAACGGEGGNDRATETTRDTPPAAEIADAGNESAGAPGSAPEVDTESSTAKDSTGDVSPTPISFKTQIAPIFTTKCIDCHHPGNAVRVDFTNVFDSEVGLINRPNSWPESSRPILVVPGDPDASALMLKIEATELDPHIEGDPMPWAIPRLTSEELTALRTWIERGAPDDDQYRRTVRPIFGDGVSLGSRGGKCAYCHYPESQFGPDLSRPFDTERGAVGVAASRGGVRIVPGDPETSVLYLRVDPTKIPMHLQPLMPLHYERVTDAEASLIRRWISEGALDN